MRQQKSKDWCELEEMNILASRLSHAKKKRTAVKTILTFFSIDKTEEASMTSFSTELHLHVSNTRA